MNTRFRRTCSVTKAHLRRSRSVACSMEKHEPDDDEEYETLRTRSTSDPHPGVQLRTSVMFVAAGGNPRALSFCGSGV
jgi:hypothetical protein